MTAIPDHLREEYEERAAIMQYDAGMSRERAERMAAERILRREGLWVMEQGALFSGDNTLAAVPVFGRGFSRA